MSDLSKSTCSGLSHIAGETPPSDSSFEQSFMIVNRDAKIATIKRCGQKVGLDTLKREIERCIQKNNITKLSRFMKRRNQ